MGFGVRVRVRVRFCSENETTVLLCGLGFIITEKLSRVKHTDGLQNIGGLIENIK